MRSTILASLALVACVDQPDLTDDSAQLGVSGRQRFEHVFPGTNGRSCASCHVLADATVLTPAHVAALDRRDPLFQRIDADDPDAAVPTYRHLEKGLVRVTLALPANMDVIDASGNVVTNAARTIEVWRGVPTVQNVAISGPTFQLDGRETNLRAQAQSAITAHAEGGAVAQAQLAQIEQFELATFSSARAAFVAALAHAGVDESDIPMPEDWLVLTKAERRGRAVFDKACAACHGGATTHRITNRPVHDQLFFALNPDGTIIHDIVDGQPVARLVPRPNDEFLNIGIGLLSGYGQLGALPMGNADIELPRYRFRFYTDGTRQSAAVDLPPIPRRADGTPVDPPDLGVPVDDRGAPIYGPSLGVQWFSTDPGRAAITGDPADFEAFDVPQLRGIARTAPYFHDNQAATLADVVDTYSRFILPFPALGLPPIYQDSPDSPFAESLTLAEKRDLVAFLQRL